MGLTRRPRLRSVTGNLAESMASAPLGQPGVHRAKPRCSSLANGPVPERSRGVVPERSRRVPSNPHSHSKKSRKRMRNRMRMSGWRPPIILQSYNPIILQKSIDHHQHSARSAVHRAGCEACVYCSSVIREHRQTFVADGSGALGAQGEGHRQQLLCAHIDPSGTSIDFYLQVLRC